MSKRLASEIDIDAGPAQVWDVLTDLTAYDEWNPFIVHADGEAQIGKRLTLRMRPAGGRTGTFRPTVLESNPGSRLRWLGRLGFPGVLDAEHTFTIEARSGGVPGCGRTRSSAACSCPSWHGPWTRARSRRSAP